MAIKIDHTEIERFLHRIWAFELLQPKQLQVLAELVRVRRLAQGEVLWLQGQRVSHFSVVYRGRLRSVRRSRKGSEKEISLLATGHHFGLAEMITGAKSALTISADQPSVILTMDGKSLRTKLLSEANICYRLMQTMARAIFRLTGELERASFETAPRRLARLLLRDAAVGGMPGPGQSPEKQLSHWELAVQIGTTRETVSRVLGQFRRRGLIETSYRSIKILDRKELTTYLKDYGEL